MQIASLHAVSNLTLYVYHDTKDLVLDLGCFRDSSPCLSFFTFSMVVLGDRGMIGDVWGPCGMCVIEE